MYPQYLFHALRGLAAEAEERAEVRRQVAAPPATPRRKLVARRARRPAAPPPCVATRPNHQAC